MNKPRKKRPGDRARKIEARSRDDLLSDLIGELQKLFEQLGLAKQVQIKFKRPNSKQPGTAGGFPPVHASALGELLTHWHQDPRYLDAAGNPVPLPIKGKSRSFIELARKSVPGVSPSYLMDELSKLGALNFDDHGHVTAALRSLPVYNDTELALLHSLRAFRGFIRTLNHNLNSGPSNLDQLFHRIAWNGDLTKDQVPRLKIWLQRHGQNFLESADNWMKINSRKSKPAYPKSKKASQASIGIYLTID